MITLIAAAIVAASSGAQDGHAHVMGRPGMSDMAMPTADSVLHETGQAEFAAIAEATRTLESDPHADWAKVNIDALRAHLVDMDNVTVRSDVVTTIVPNGARFSVTSADPKVSASIGRMVSLHGGMANDEGPYRIEVQGIPSGVVMTVTGRRSEDATRIRALGFFGLLTEGMHHQQHHLMLAKGEGMHH